MITTAANTPTGSSIAVNGRFLGQRVTGVQRYAREITRRWECDFATIEPSRAAGGMRGHFWEQTVLPRAAADSLLWSPAGTGPLLHRHQVITIHDCAFIDHRECFSPAFAAWYGWLAPRLAKRVRGVVTVSDFSKQRIVECLGVPEEKVTVIPNGVSEDFRRPPEDQIEETRKRLGLPNRFALCVGSLDPRKNLRRLLRAWRAIRVDLPDHQLLIVGGSHRAFRESPLEETPGVVWAGYLEDRDLPTVYSAAEVFVYPSLYEGFGLTVLEAMACDTPVICSNSTSLPEVAGDAAIQVDPQSETEIAEALRAVLKQQAPTDRLRQLGRLRAKSFRWQTSAEQTWKLLTDVARQRA